MTMFSWLIFWVIPCAVACVLIARHKGRSEGGWFLLGCLFGWFAVIAALLVENSNPPCDACKGRVHKDAKLCPHCQTPRDPTAAMRNKKKTAPMFRVSHDTTGDAVVAIAVFFVAVIGLSFLATIL